MSISQIYSTQYRWRRWFGVYPDPGDISDTLVLDLGCGIGDQARDLSGLGANVLGVDANQDAIDHANRRGIPRARFLCDNIMNLKEHEHAGNCRRLPGNLDPPSGIRKQSFPSGNSLAPGENLVLWRLCGDLISNS